METLALKNAEWEAAYPRSAAHMQGARKNARNRYRAFFDDSGKLKPGMAEYITRTPGAKVFGNPQYYFAIGPDYSSSQERDIEESTVAHLRRRARPRTQAVYDDAGNIVKWVRPTPAHSAYPIESESVASEAGMWTVLSVLTPLAQAFRQVARSYNGGDGSGASNLDEEQLDLLKAMLALRATCKTALCAKDDGRLMTRPLRRQAIRLQIRRWNRRMVHVEAYGVAVMSACYGIQKKVDLLCRKFDTEEGKPRTADALMSDWMREVGHIDYSNACAFYEKDKMFTLHVADVMSRSTNRTGVNRFWEKECAISWEWAMSPMARAIRQKISDMRERICTCIKRNCELMIEPQGRVLEQRARANEKRGLPGQHVADGCLFVLEGYADEFGREVRKLIADWKSSNAMSVREQHHYEKRFFHCRVHARRDDHNLSVFLKTSSSEWFIDQDANEGPLLIDSPSIVDTPEKTESEELATEFLSLCDAKAGMYYDAHPDAHKSRWNGAYAEPAPYGNPNWKGWDNRIEKFDRLLRERNNSMEEAFESFCSLEAIRAETQFYSAHALELEEWIKKECKLIDWSREERCGQWARAYEWRRAAIDETT